jgi:hypothetical protein
MAETEHREAEHTAGLINIGVGFVTNLPRRCHPPAGVRPSGGGRMGFVAGLVAGDAERPWPSARVWPRFPPPCRLCPRDVGAGSWFPHCRRQKTFGTSVPGGLGWAPACARREVQESVRASAFSATSATILSPCQVPRAHLSGF